MNQVEPRLGPPGVSGWALFPRPSPPSGTAGSRAVLLSLSDPSGRTNAARHQSRRRSAWKKPSTPCVTSNLTGTWSPARRTTTSAWPPPGARPFQRAFWAGFDRGWVDGFHDYFCQLTDAEPKRAANSSCNLTGLTSTQKDYGALAWQTMSWKSSQFLDARNVLGIGEIGLNKNSRNEIAVLEEPIMAARHNQLILGSHPASRGQLKGTRGTSIC